MEKQVIKECLGQLITVLVYSEQQYVHATIRSNTPTLHIFYRERAFERSDFITQVQHYIEKTIDGSEHLRSYEEFCEWHNRTYGTVSLKVWPVTDIDSLIIDEKVLEIYNYLLDDGLPQTLHELLHDQATIIEESLRSLTYLRSMN